MSLDFDVSIIIPVYNEKRSLEKLILKILTIQHQFSYQIIVIDSGSNDGSSEIINRICQKYKLTQQRLEKNKGKGYAVRKGLELATGRVILIQDADLEYEPEDYNRLVQPVLSNEKVFVLGSRHLYLNNWRIRSSKKFNLSLEIINVGSQILTFIFCKLFSVKIRDTQTMYKVFKKDLIKDIHFSCNGFDFDWELLGKLILKGHVPYEIPVQYKSRTAAEGKKLHFAKDGLQALITILKVRWL